ncbi:MAG: nitrite reductase, copper-containing [Ardenticatenaceae bacterium]|nr:nitrite reductase, copper-containing [Anaerolineales bacterium]MCB9009399.1 nitrite reductase, copper-containing [Ardenticatenaceae bacterium]
MSIQTNQTSELPWDRRPVTSRDLAIFVGVIALLCIGGAALLAFSIRDQSGTTAAGANGAAVSTVDQPAEARSIALGQEIFTAKCTACHTIGEGVRVGPDLQGVTQQRDPDWLARWITEPDVMLAEGDPTATELLAEHNNVPMPNLQLSSEEVDNVIAYLAHPDGSSVPTVIEYSLRTSADEAGFVGVGGYIDGVLNPELSAHLGDTIRLTLINDSVNAYDLKIDAFDVSSGELTAADESATVEFVVDQLGMFHYYASLPGQRDAGLEGVLRVEGVVSIGDEAAMAQSVGGSMDHAMSTVSAGPAVADAVSIIRNPADLPPPITTTEPQHHVVELTAMEVDGQLDDGSTFRYMTFNGQVPGPMLRMRIGDTMEVRINNQIESILPHSIDLHAVTGPGGGAEFTQTMAGEVSTFNFRALQPGLYVYHCATPSIAHHISSGMYGLILVEPEEGLPSVDHEFYVMQGEIYTEQPFGTEGHLTFSHQQMLNETPQYYVFNGAANALTLDEYAMRTAVGDSVRIYFGVGGPNKISSFHMIGEIFDRVYPMASLSSPPLEDVQTTMVPPGGATVVEFTMDVPGRYIMVDHALSRLERGLVGFLYAEGEENPDIFGAEGFPEESGH